MKIKPIATWADLFNRIKETGIPLMHILGVPKQTAHNMRKHGIIAPAHWYPLVEWAQKNGIPEITIELLGHLAARHPLRSAAE